MEAFPTQWLIFEGNGMLDCGEVGRSRRYLGGEPSSLGGWSLVVTARTLTEISTRSQRQLYILACWCSQISVCQVRGESGDHDAFSLEAFPPRWLVVNGKSVLAYGDKDALSEAVMLISAVVFAGVSVIDLGKIGWL